MNYLSEKASTVCTFATKNNIKAKEKLFSGDVNGFIYNGQRGISNSLYYGCFERFRGLTGGDKDIFLFSHGVYPKIIENIVETFNATFNNIHIEIVRSEDINVLIKSDGYRNKKYGAITTGKTEAKLLSYYFKVTVNEKYHKHKILIYYLVHHLIRLFALQEAGMIGLGKLTSNNIEDMGEFYNKNGFFNSIILLNDYAQDPRRLYHGKLTEDLIKKIFSIEIWFELGDTFKSYSSYHCQTTIVRKINRIVLPENIYEIDINSEYVKGRKLCDSEYNYTNSRMTKAKIVSIDEIDIVIKILEHKNELAINKRFVVRHQDIIPYNLEDTNSKFPFEYQGINNHGK